MKNRKCKMHVLALGAVLVSGQALAQEPAPPTEEPQPIAKVTPPTSAQLAARLSALLGRPGGLTAEAAARRAIATNPAARERQQEAPIAEEARTQALLAMIPRATITARYTRYSPITPPSFGPGTGSFVGTSVPEGPVPAGAPLFAIPASEFTFPVILDNYLLQTSLLLPISDIPLRALHNYEAAKHDRNAADIDVKVADRQAAFNAKTAYWDWVRLAMDQVVADQTLAQSEVQLQATDALLQAGKVSKADLLQAQARLAQSKQMQDRARHAAQAAAERLAILMHDRSSPSYRIGEDPTAIALVPASRPLGSLYQEAMSKRPEIAGLDEQSRSLLQQREASKASMYPQLSGFADFIYANPNPRFIPQIAEFRGTWDVGAQLVWSPNDVPGALSAANSLEARRREILARRDELADAIEDDVRQAEQAMRDAETALENTEIAILAAEEAYRIRVERYRYGRATPVELSDSETALLRARLDRVDAQVGARVAEIRLGYALGR